MWPVSAGGTGHSSPVPFFLPLPGQEQQQANLGLVVGAEGGQVTEVRLLQSPNGLHDGRDRGSRGVDLDGQLGQAIGLAGMLQLFPAHGELFAAGEDGGSRFFHAGGQLGLEVLLGQLNLHDLVACQGLFLPGAEQLGDVPAHL